MFVVQTPGTLTHCSNNHHVLDTAKDLLAKPAFGELTPVGLALANNI
jgi:hypothetical protein